MTFRFMLCEDALEYARERGTRFIIQTGCDSGNVKLWSSYKSPIDKHYQVVPIFDLNIGVFLCMISYGCNSAAGSLRVEDKHTASSTLVFDVR